MGSGVRGVDPSLYLPIRDTRRTFRHSSPRAQIQREYALQAHAVYGVGGLGTLATVFMMTVSGFVAAVSQAMLIWPTIPEFLVEDDAEQIVGCERRGGVRQRQKEKGKSKKKSRRVSGDAMTQVGPMRLWMIMRKLIVAAISVLALLQIGSSVGFAQTQDITRQETLRGSITPEREWWE